MVYDIYASAVLQSTKCGLNPNIVIQSHDDPYNPWDFLLKPNTHTHQNLTARP